MARKGLLLVNLGSPASTDPRDVRRYLNQFLTDPYVIDLPAFIRHPLVRGLISPRRAPLSAHAYATIWTEQGSPLIHFSRSFAAKLARAVGDEYEVRWAMRYGQPSIPATLADWDVEELLVVPMYPQYAESSTRTAIEEVRKYAARVSLKILNDFYDHPAFIASEAKAIGDFIADFKPDHLLLSYHGLPEHHLRKLHPAHCLETPNCCDQIGEVNKYCYRAQCFATTRAISAKLDFPSQKITLSFQSRLGRRPWIKPYTDFVIPELVKNGVRKLAVASPSFTCDCLETLEEIQVRLREQFIECGGTELRLVPALNDQDHWVENFRHIVRDLASREKTHS